MTQPGRPVTEDELHAYVDGALDPARRLAIAAYLAAHPREAARTEAFRAQREGIRALFDHVLDQPVPQRLHEIMLRHGARAALRRFAWALTTASLTLTLLICGGQLLRTYLPFSRPAQLVAPATTQHQPTGTDYPVIRPVFPRGNRVHDTDI